MAVAVVGAVLVGSPAVAHADDWRVVGKGLVESSRPYAGQVGNQVGILWSTPRGTLHSATVRRDGGLTAARTLLSGWTFLSPDPVGVGRRVVAAGLRGRPGEPDSWPGAGFVSSGGTLTRLTASDFAYLSQGQDAASVAGALVYVHTDGGTGVWVSPSGGVPGRTQSGTAYMPAIAADPAGTWVAWYAADAAPGLYVAPVFGLPSTVQFGSVSVAPGSQTSRPAQRVALVTRAGSAWLAYPVADDRVRVWRVGDTGWRDLAARPGVAAVDLSVSPDGRTWLAYTAHNTVCTRRSDPSGERFGTPTCARLPEPTSVTTAGADVVATSGSRALHARFLPTPSVRLRRTAGVVRVTDAGLPVPRARITVLNTQRRTNARGVARIGAWRKGAEIVVRAGGYETVRLPG